MTLLDQLKAMVSEPEVIEIVETVEAVKIVDSDLI